MGCFFPASGYLHRLVVTDLWPLLRSNNVLLVSGTPEHSNIRPLELVCEPNYRAPRRYTQFQISTCGACFSLQTEYYLEVDPFDAHSFLQTIEQEDLLVSLSAYVDLGLSLWIKSGETGFPCPQACCPERLA